ICEGKPLSGSKPKNAAFDAKAYNTIFAESYPETVFVSAGSCLDVTKDSIKLAAALGSLVPGVNAAVLIDRDDNSTEQVGEIRTRGGKILSRYSIENFVWSDEMLELLCDSRGCSESDKQEILDLKKNLVKRAAGQPEGPLEHVKDIAGQL